MSKWHILHLLKWKNLLTIFPSTHPFPNILGTVPHFLPVYSPPPSDYLRCCPDWTEKSDLCLTQNSELRRSCHILSRISLISKDQLGPVYFTQTHYSGLPKNMGAKNDYLCALNPSFYFWNDDFLDIVERLLPWWWK